MAAETSSPASAAPAANPPVVHSLVRGGPFYRTQQTLRLFRPDRWHLVRRTLIFVVIAWLPPFLLTAILNPGGLNSFLVDYRVYARTLIAIPVLLIGEILVDSTFGSIQRYLHNSGLLNAPDMTYMQDVLVTLVRLRDGLLPELVIVVLIVIRISLSYGVTVDSSMPWLALSTGADFHLTAAGWYAAVVTAPLWNFLFLLGIWRWLLWTFFAFKLSRQNLKVVPTHPDGHGGLGFLGLAASAFAPIALAGNAVIGSAWRQDILFHGAHLMDLKLSAIVLVVIIALIALGPLLFFVPRLAAQRRMGIVEYGILGQLHSSEFHEKWITHRAGHESEFLQAAEITTLANYNDVFDTIDRLKPFPVDKFSLYILAAAIAIPALPVLLAQLPLSVVLKDLMTALR
jgi:hypothetical protein